MMGDAVSFASRPVSVNGFAVPVILEKDQVVELLILLDKRNEFISSKLGLYELSEFHQKKRIEFGVFTSYLGMAVFLLLFHFFLWLSLKDRVHWLFIGQLVSSSMYLAASAGYLNEWPLWDLPYKLSTVSSMMVFSWTGFSLLFLNSFLKLDRTNSLFYRFNHWLGYLNLALALGWGLTIIFKEYPLNPGYIKNSVILMEIVYSVNLICFSTTLIEQNIKRNAMARIYGLAILFILLGFTLNILGRRNVLFDVQEYLSQFGRHFSWIVPGIFFEQVILAFGLTIRYNVLNRQNIDLTSSLIKVKSETSEKIIHAQEAEHQRLAQDLHDGMGGTLSAIKGRAASENVSEETLELIEKAIKDFRSVSHNLVPSELEKIGLMGSVSQKVESLRNISQTEFIFITFGRQVPLDSKIELNIYRIINELLNNILKHAEASKGVVQLLYFDDYLLISVEDNGKGIETEEKNWGIGLKNVYSRVKHLKSELGVDTGPYGTTIMFKVPY